MLLSPLQGCTKSNNKMRISFARSGGFAGIILTTSVDTATLPAEEANQLHQLVEAADFFNLPATITSPAPQYDRFQYKLTVEENGKEHTVMVNEPAVPETLKPLIQWLIDAARKK